MIENHISFRLFEVSLTARSSLPEAVKMGLGTGLLKMFLLVTNFMVFVRFISYHISEL